MYNMGMSRARAGTRMRDRVGAILANAKSIWLIAHNAPLCGMRHSELNTKRMRIEKPKMQGRKLGKPKGGTAAKLDCGGRCRCERREAIPTPSNLPPSCTTTPTFSPHPFGGESVSGFFSTLSLHGGHLRPRTAPLRTRRSSSPEPPKPTPMNPTNDPLFRHILGGLLAQGMHPDTAVERAGEMYRDIRSIYPPEPHLYRLAFVLLLLLSAIVITLLR